MRAFGVLTTILLILLAGAGVFLIYLGGGFSGITGFAAKSSSGMNGNAVQDANSGIGYSNSSQFYPNMRYEDKRISYFIDSACGDDKKVDIALALGVIANETILQFYPRSENPEISFLCSDIAPTSEEEGHFIAGEGGPSSIINATNFAVIYTGKVSLYRAETCSEPKIATHEILHALGFDHDNNPGSIMYPITGCSQAVDQSIIEEINRLYSIKSASDLIVEKATANETSGYLNFEILIANYGLKSSKSASLAVFSDGEKIKDFALQEIDVGAQKSLTVQNVELPNAGTKISFVVTSSDPSDDIYPDNNKLELKMA